ncbi:hypothetical protein SAMN02927895_00029 [Belnapia rosea]|nr:hypothetical protein SAMN02927895_00029 [Belnapia rosea]
MRLGIGVRNLCPLADLVRLPAPKGDDHILRQVECGRTGSSGTIACALRRASWPTPPATRPKCLRAGTLALCGDHQVPSRPPPAPVERQHRCVAPLGTVRGPQNLAILHDERAAEEFPRRGRRPGEEEPRARVTETPSSAHEVAQQVQVELAGIKGRLHGLGIPCSSAPLASHEDPLGANRSLQGRRPGGARRGIRTASSRVSRRSRCRSSACGPGRGTDNGSRARGACRPLHGRRCAGALQGQRPCRDPVPDARGARY